MMRASELLFPLFAAVLTLIPYIVLSLVLRATQVTGAKQKPTQHPFSPILEAILQAVHGRQKNAQIPKAR